MAKAATSRKPSPKGRRSRQPAAGKPASKRVRANTGSGGNGVNALERSTFTAVAGLRQALSANQPGNWATDHRQEAEHCTDWVAIALRAICLQAMQATVNVFDDSGPTGHARKSHRQHDRSQWRDSPSLRTGNRQYWKRLKGLYGQEQQKTEPLPHDARIVQLMRYPNPAQTGAIFRYEQVMQLQLTATCIVWNIPNRSGATVERHVIPTACAAPVNPSRDLPRGGYRVDPLSSRFFSPTDDQGFVEMSGYFNAIGRVIPSEQCQIIRWPHPILKDDGLSMVAACARFVDLSDQVNTARWSQMVNGFEPSLVILLPDGVDPSPDDLEQITAKFQSRYGGTHNHRKVIVTNGQNVVTLNTTPKDMDYDRGHDQSKAAVLALMGTSPVAASIQEPGAFAAYYASLKQFISGTCQPIFDLLAESDSCWFGRKRPSPIYPHGEILEYPEGLTVEMEAAPINNSEITEREIATDTAAGAIEVDEIRAIRGRPLWGGARGRAVAGQQMQAQGVPQDPSVSQAMTNPTQPGLSQADKFPAPEKLSAPATGPDAEGAATANGSQDVQVAEEFVLNGAQITAATKIVENVAAGLIPRDAGIGQLEILFNLKPEQAQKIMGSAGTSTPTTPNPMGGDGARAEPSSPLSGEEDDASGSNDFPSPNPPITVKRAWAKRVKNCGTGAGGFKPGNTCAAGDGSGGGTAVSDRRESAPADAGAEDDDLSEEDGPSRPAKDNIKPDHRLPDGFHTPGNSTKKRDVKVKPVKIGDVSSPKKTDSVLAGADLLTETTVRGRMPQNMDVLEGTMRRDEVTLKQAIERLFGEALQLSEAELAEQPGIVKDAVRAYRSGAADQYDADVRERRRAMNEQTEAMRKKGFVRVLSQEHAMELIGGELTSRLGIPEQSSLSPSKYWHMENGRSVRVSNHSPVYFFEDSGVNIVPAEFTGKPMRGTDVPIPLNSFINPKLIAEWAIDKNSKLPPVDVAAAKERTGMKSFRWNDTDARFLMPPSGWSEYLGVE